ncbi:MAG: FAD-linked oxidase C-terminal domain-containing protein [Planctomycetota bacterium]
MTTAPGATAVATSLRIDPAIDRRRHAEALTELVEGEVRFGEHDRKLYATDASLYQVEPIGVLIPRDASDLHRAVVYCHEHGLAMLPRGGGTSLAGQCVNEAVVLDTSAWMRGLIQVDAGARMCRAEAGLAIADLNRLLEPHSLFFAPDPSTVKQANVGGCIGNNAAGTRSIKYGRTAESVRGVDVVLADGTPARLEAGAAARDQVVRRLTVGVVDVVDRHRALIRQRFPKTLRRNAGYALDMMLDQVEAAERDGADAIERVNLAPLICGSEGTLAIVTAAELALHPVPKAKALGVLGFAGLDEAIEQVPALLELGPSAVELLDDMVIATGRLNAQCRPFVERLPPPVSDGDLMACLYVEFLEHDEVAVAKRLESLQVHAAAWCPDAGLALETEAGAIDDLLALRRAGEPLLHAIPGSRKPLGFIEDNAVPVERLGEFVRRLRAIIDAQGTRAAFYAHASVGVLHVRPLLDLRDPADEARMHEIAERTAALAKELGGVMSGEHGDGRARGPLLDEYFGPELIEAFREVKAIFDPRGLLNPGNIVSPGAIASISERTRLKPDGRTIPRRDVDTYFEYASAGGYDHAVELCNGSGVCRKTQGGVMCPSYMATRDERHTTRGRGNALRLAMTGQLESASRAGEPTWDDPEVHETLRLCLSCKACKSECPTNVDVATYKAEYLAQSYKSRGGASLQAHAFAEVRWLNRMGSVLAPVSNVLSAAAPSRAIANRVLGLAPQRSLPLFAPSLMRQVRRGERRGRLNADLPADAPTVVLFADCFTAFNEPEIGLASIELLNAFGYHVEVADVGCCGRTHVSVGLLERAQSVISTTAARLAAAVKRTDAAGVLVCEPSCLSAIQDEWQDLKHPGRAEARRIAGAASLVEQFLEERWDVHPRCPEPAGSERSVALHAHCHQKALLGADSSAGFLRRVFGSDNVEVLDTTCCGMAGSFGYMADRVALSEAIAEISLLPAVRGLDPEAAVVAPGTSCRHQLAEVGGQAAQHPVVAALEHMRKTDVLESPSKRTPDRI